MPHLATLEPEIAPKEVVDVYNDFQRRMGFPGAPNFIKTQGHSLAAPRGTWGLVKNVLVEGLLPRTLKETMFVAMSQSRNCRYCDAAHLACCRMLGVEPAVLEGLVTNVANISPAKVRDIILFGLKCGHDRQSLSEERFRGAAQSRSRAIRNHGSHRHGGVGRLRKHNRRRDRHVGGRDVLANLMSPLLISRA